jgi:uncharacterized lipoprotein YmbA
MNIKLACGAAALIIACGCSSTPPTRLYVLETTPVSPLYSLPADLRLTLGPVMMPEYLERQQIVVRDGGRLRMSGYDRWGEPLGRGVTSILTEQLSAATGSEILPFMWPGGTAEDWRIPLEIIRFEAQAPGRVLLEARWVLMSPDGEETGSRHRASFESPVDTDDHEQIVRVSSQLLSELAVDIARGLPETFPAQ